MVEGQRSCERHKDFLKWGDRNLEELRVKKDMSQEGEDELIPFWLRKGKGYKPKSRRCVCWGLITDKVGLQRRVNNYFPCTKPRRADVRLHSVNNP